MSNITALLLGKPIIIPSSSKFSIHPLETSSREINSLDLVSLPHLTSRNSIKKKMKEKKKWRKKSRNCLSVPRDVQRDLTVRSFREFPVGNHRRAWPIGKFSTGEFDSNARSSNEFHRIGQIERRKFVTFEIHGNAVDCELGSEHRVSLRENGQTRFLLSH